MTHANSHMSAKSSKSSLVLYCIVRREKGGGDPAACFLMMQKPGGWTFSPRSCILEKTSTWR